MERQKIDAVIQREAREARHISRNLMEMEVRKRDCKKLLDAARFDENVDGQLVNLVGIYVRILITSSLEQLGGPSSQTQHVLLVATVCILRRIYPQLWNHIYVQRQFVDRFEITSMLKAPFAADI